MESFLRAFLFPSSSDSTTIRGASSKDKGGKEEIDAMVDTGSSSDKEICERDGQAQADHQEGGRASCDATPTPWPSARLTTRYAQTCG